MSAVPYAGVFCHRGCGHVDIDEAEYSRQLDRPDVGWRCPRCGDSADFDDERFEELQGLDGDEDPMPDPRVKSCPPRAWRPIAEAPRDNKVPLYLARFDAQGKLQELDFDGSWGLEQESWEMPSYYVWMSAGGIEEPTHWCYQENPPKETQPVKTYSLTVELEDDATDVDLAVALRAAAEDAAGQIEGGIVAPPDVDESIRFTTGAVRATATLDRTE